MESTGNSFKCYTSFVCKWDSRQPVGLRLNLSTITTTLETNEWTQNVDEQQAADKHRVTGVDWKVRCRAPVPNHWVSRWMNLIKRSDVDTGRGFGFPNEWTGPGAVNYSVTPLHDSNLHFRVQFNSKWIVRFEL